MKERLLEFLVCPKCKESFACDTSSREGDEIMEGSLTCAPCQRTYPITRGIPRILEDVEDPSTQEAFGFQWERMYNSAIENREEEKHQFDRKIALDGSEFKGKLVLDAGCGIGRYSYFAAQYGAEVISIDFSRAVDTAYKYTAGKPVHVIQADIFNLPFRPTTFDIIMSFGVLHHTPSTHRAFESLVPLVKPGGITFIWLYAQRSCIVEGINNFIRFFTTRIPDKILYKLSYIPALIGNIPVIKNLCFLISFSVHKDFRMRVNDNFDWYNPPYQYLHNCEEVVQWYQTAKFDQLIVTSLTWFDQAKYPDVKVLHPDTGFPRALHWLLGRYMSVGVRGRKI